MLERSLRSARPDCVATRQVDWLVASFEAMDLRIDCLIRRQIVVCTAIRPHIGGRIRDISGEESVKARFEGRSTWDKLRD